MFIQAIVLAVVIGLILGGSLSNLSNLKIDGIYIIIAAFLLDAAGIWSVRLGFVAIGQITFIIDVIMYILLLAFVLKNIRNPYIVTVGVGFLLNAVVIFANGGAMPVGAYAVHAAGLNLDVTTQGLYVPVTAATRFWYLGDIIPYTFLNINIISIGDMVSAAGIMLLVITSMKKVRNMDMEITSLFGSGINRN
jgi:hypothetical protein